jgi:hypothetical protein
MTRDPAFSVNPSLNDPSFVLEDAPLDPGQGLIGSTAFQLPPTLTG